MLKSQARSAHDTRGSPIRLVRCPPFVGKIKLGLCAERSSTSSNAVRQVESRLRQVRTRRCLHGTTLTVIASNRHGPLAFAGHSKSLEIVDQWKVHLRHRRGTTVG